MKLPIGSYSLYNNFENCPHKAYHIYVVKDIPRVETPEMKWGNDVHSAMEHRVADGTPLPDAMAAGEPLAATLHALKERYPVQVELQLAMDASGKPVPYKAYDRAWFRGKLDVVVRDAENVAAWINDWKTGKVREEPFELETNALLLKVNYPTLAEIVGNYFWLQTGQKGMRYTLNDHSRVFGRLQALRSEMESYADKGEWPKRRNPLCGWCPVLSCENNTSGRR